MEAANFIGNEKIKIETKGIPTVKANEVLIKVGYCGLCGSDKRLFYNGANVVPGHEISGIISKVGGNVDNLSVGTHVMIYIPLYCGKCEECQSGNNNRCQSINGLVGWQVPGGYEEYLVVPAKNAIPIPDDIGLDEGVLLLDTIGTPAHGIRMCLKSIGLQKPQRAAVIGCGAIGMGSSLVLDSMGCKELFAFDIDESRLQLAESFGSNRIDPNEESLNSSFPIVIEATGSAGGRSLALDLVKAGGAVLILGESNNPWVITPTPKLRRKDCFYVRSFYFQLNEVQENIKILRTNRSKFKKLITKIGTLKDIKNMHQEFCAGKTIKPLIKLYSE